MYNGDVGYGGVKWMRLGPNRFQRRFHDDIKTLGFMRSGADRRDGDAHQGQTIFCRSLKQDLTTQPCKVHDDEEQQEVS